MVGKTHQLIGFASVYTFIITNQAIHLNTQTMTASILLISIGSLTPDLDDQHNKLYTLTPIGSGIFAEIGGRVFGKHRSISHSILGLVIFGYISHFLIYKIPVQNGLDHAVLWYSFFISLISHIAADFITKEGVPLLWPIKWRFGFPPFKALRIKTGSLLEIYAIRAIVLIYLIITTYIYWQNIKTIF